MIRFALILLFAWTAFAADPIDISRRVAWQGNVGIVGGIPIRTTIYTNLPAGSSLATVQSALNNCPSNQVALLAAGSYGPWNGDLDFSTVADGVTLRGAGPTTIITASGQMLMRGNTSEAALSTEANLSVSATKGSSTLTLASVPSWVTVGGLVGVDQLDDSAFVSGGGTEGGAGYREIMGNGTRGMGQICRVTAKDATTITVEIPLYYGWDTAKTAQIFQPFYVPGTGDPVRYCGIEDMKIIGGTSDGGTHMILMEDADQCWVKNVEIQNMVGASGIKTVGSYRCEFRQNYIHDSHLVDGGHGYGITIWHDSSACLIEDNILSGLHIGIGFAFGSSGNVVAYNYIKDGLADSTQSPSLSTHGVHCWQNLFEGNYCEDKLLADWTHGSSSHTTFFRNRVTGENGVNDQRACVSVEYYNRYYNIVGNVLGVPGRQNKAIEHSSSTSQGSQGSISKLGGEVNINDDFSPADAYAYASGGFILYHRNYDTFTAGIIDESGIDTTLNASYYLASQSTNCIIPYSPIGPVGTNATSYTNIQAGHRFTFGTNFIASGGGQPDAPTGNPRGPKIRGIRIK